jgi:hypothetical protein
VSRSLGWIKEKQKEYKELFGMDLEIDFVKMKNIKNFDEKAFEKSLVDDYFEKCIQIYKPNIELIKSGPIKKKSVEKESRFLKDFCSFVVREKLPVVYAASLINKERSSIYYLGGTKKSSYVKKNSIKEGKQSTQEDAA